MKTFYSIIGLVVLVLMLSFSGCTTVDTGHRGVKTRFGEVVSESLPEGIYFYNPITTNVVQFDTRTQRFAYSDATYTKDVQQANLGYVVNYNLEKDATHIMFQEVGADWQNVLIPQVVSGTMKNVIGKWNAVDLIANRDKATLEIEIAVKAALAARNVTVSKFEITNIDYNEAFEQAVEAKVTAIERAKESENKTKQVEEEAKQKIISAKAEAESMSIRANALTQNKALVEYEAVQKWDGKLPQIMLGSESMPMINLQK